MRNLTLISSLFVLSATVSAQNAIDSTYIAELDSLVHEAEKMRAVKETIRQFEEMKLSQERRFDYSCITPILNGTIYSLTERDYIRHCGTLPSKSEVFGTVDYAVAGLPLATAWALKMAGVKSRSTTKRMLTANALSMAATVGIGKMIKSVTNETRPDASDNHSMPSGHTAIAFASASILAREYGDLSPWVAVGSYATATTTQYLRLRHNRHWINDLYMGAGIGMLATNVGYWLTDRIFNKNGILTPPEVRLKDMQRVVRYNNQPSGIALVSGSEFGNRTFTIDNATIKSQASFSMGIDVSWFVNQTLALELIARSTTGYAKVYDSGTQTASQLTSSAQQDHYSADDMLLHHIDLAACYSVPFALGQRLHTRAFAGVRHMSSMHFANSNDQIDMPSQLRAEAGAGFGYDAIDKKNFAAGFSCDYIHTFSSVMSDRLNISTTWKVLF